ncbi:MAG TPA: sigma-54 dependent transcriptional regulator [Gemmatimonadaceae bacterium]|nr:sigma-54 dependent transcriptional regulator [Gemmatimonadaceae bacterium]
MSAPSVRPHPIPVPQGAPEFAAVVGESAAIRHAVHVARKIAVSPLRAVLIAGEAGTGKELLARCIHNAGPNSDAPFVPLNCAALPEPLLDAELFGNAGGEGQGRKPGILELTGRGTVFLDEIGELPRPLQGKLLRALEEYSVRRYGGLTEVAVHCRVIAATKTRMDDRVAAGTFREDLLGRLSVLRIELPPLRERGDDVHQIAAVFLAEGGRIANAPPKQLGLDAVAAIRMHRWPGNIRELKQVLERAIVVCDSPLIGADHLMIQQRRSLAASTRGGTGFGEIRIPLAGKRLRDVEREAIELTLQLTNHNQSAAARILCISRPTLARKIRAYGLTG